MHDQWLADEAKQRDVMSRGVGPGVNSLESIAGMTGLAIMQGILHGQLHYPPIADTLNFLLVDVSPGKAVFQGTPSPEHLNPMGSIHGGWFATLLDSALACAIQTMIPLGRAYTTTELNLTIVRGLTQHSPRVRAEGHVLHCGKQLATAEGKLLGPDGTLYAHATTVCLVFEMKGRS